MPAIDINLWLQLCSLSLATGEAWLQSCISRQKCHWSNYCDNEFSLSNQIASVGNIFLLSHLKLIILPIHSPTNTRHNITSKEKFGTGTPPLADMPIAVHRQNSWKITGWSHGTVSMAMHCLGYNKLTPDGSLANHVFTQRPLWQLLTRGLRHFFPDSPHLRPFLLKLVKMWHTSYLDSGQQHMWPHPQAITRRSNDV